jgi:hypothetical protein
MNTPGSFLDSVNSTLSVRIFGNLADDLTLAPQKGSDLGKVYGSDELLFARIVGAQVSGMCFALPRPIFLIVPGKGDDPQGCSQFGDKTKYRMWSFPKGEPVVSLIHNVGSVEDAVGSGLKPFVDIQADFHFHDVSLNGTVLTANLRSYLKIHQSIPWPGSDINIVIIDRDDRFTIDFSSVPCITVFSIGVASAQVCYHPNPNRICGEVVVGIDLPWPIGHWGQTFTIACLNF